MNLPDFFTCYDIKELQQLHKVSSEKYKTKFWSTEIIVMSAPVFEAFQYTMIDRDDLQAYEHYYGSSVIVFEGTLSEFINQDFLHFPFVQSPVIHSSGEKQF